MIQVTDSAATSTSPSEADSTTDLIAHILRQGARKLLAAESEAEAEAFRDSRQHLRDEYGRQLVLAMATCPNANC